MGFIYFQKNPIVGNARVRGFSRMEMVHRDENEKYSFRLLGIILEILSDFNLNENGKGYEKWE